jgi:hypothetical protein
MGRFGFVGPSYRSQSLLADCQTCMNWYLESIESGMGRSASALYPSPGLSLLYALGGAGVRGEGTFQGRSFAVTGTTLWELLAPNANPNKINRGTIVSDGKPVSMAGGANQVLIASAGRSYVFSLNQAVTSVAVAVGGGSGALPNVATVLCKNNFTPGATPIVTGLTAGANTWLNGQTVTVTAATPTQFSFYTAQGAYVAVVDSGNLFTPVDPSGGGNVPVAQVAYADGFFFALVMNVGTPWQISSSNALDATTWQAVNYTIVEEFSDNPIGIFVNQRILWVFGPKGIQPYADTGDFPFPFDVIPGTYIENGLGAPFSVVKLDNSLFWVGADERGTGVVWRMNGFTPQRVSNHAIEYALQSYPTIADAVAYAYQDQGHSFYVLSLPSADKTWVYDVATGSWHERGYWNSQAGVFNRHRAAFHTFNFGMHLVGDPTTGNIYQMSINILNDFGNPIRRVRRAPHISKELKRLTHNSLQVDAEVGIGPNIQGNEPATLFYLTDADGNIWQLGVTDVGAFGLIESNAGQPETLYLNDPESNTSWQIIPTVIGQPMAVAVPYSASYPVAQQMVSQTGNTRWIINVRQVAPDIAQLIAQPLGIVGRGPLWIMIWSDDGAKTWSNEHARDGGMLGQYRQRLLWNRLGSPLLDRVYELSTSEAVPARILEAYLDAQDYTPSERLVKQIAKSN